MYTYMLSSFLFGRLFVRFCFAFVFVVFGGMVDGTPHADGLSCSNLISSRTRVKHIHSYTVAYTHTPIMHNLCKYKKTNLFILKKKESLILFSLCSGAGWLSRARNYLRLSSTLNNFFFSLNYM